MASTALAAPIAQPLNMGPEGALDVAIAVDGRTYRVGAPAAGSAESLGAAAALVERHAQTLVASGLSPNNAPPSRFFLMTALLVADEAISAARAAGGDPAAAGGGMARALDEQAFERAMAEILSAAADKIDALASKVEKL